MSVDEALRRLGRSTVEALDGVLRMFLAEDVEIGDVTIVREGSQALMGVPTPAVAANVSYVDGVTGGNVVVLPTPAARGLAHAMMGQQPPADAVGELDELEMSAVGEAMNQMMAAAAAATSKVLGTEVEIAPPRTVQLESLSDALEVQADTAYVISASLTVLGQSCRLVQLVPNAFVIRMTQALDEMGAEYLVDSTEAASGDAVGLDEVLRGVDVRLWAELGRRTMRIGDLVGAPVGAVLDLDRSADEPVDVYVNGLRFATASLLVADGGEWALRIEELHRLSPLPNTTRKGGGS